MVLHKTRKLINEFKNDINGNFGVMAATTVLGLISAVGLSVDGQRVYSHAAKTQSVADAAGLSAAIHASSNGGMIPNTGASGVFIEGQTYSATELGFELGTGENITFMVEYNETDREVTVTTEGTITPLMLQLIGKSEITTSSSSTVKFDEPGALNPASVLFVLDNSGSMLFDDIPLDFSNLNSTEVNSINAVLRGETSRNFANNVVAAHRQTDAIARVEALRQNMTTFNTQLASTIGAQGDSNNFLRTGLITYNNALIRQKSMDWGALDQIQDIDSMAPIGGTNSSVAFNAARNDFNDENDQHLNRNGSLTPSKYLVFMSDGQNTDQNNPTVWRAVPDIAPSGQYRTSGANVCVSRNSSGTCIQNVNDIFGQTFVHWDVDVQGFVTINGRNFRLNGNANATTPNEAGLSGTWEEGRYITSGDNTTINRCNQLKSQNVTIYTIAFALDRGFFNTNNFPDVAFNNYSSRNQINRIDRDNVERAFSLLDACATDNSTFLLANNANDLTIAFSQIRQQIAQDVVRLRE